MNVILDLVCNKTYEIQNIPYVKVKDIAVRLFEMASGNHKKHCLKCENFKRKIEECDQTVSARDIIIQMLQDEVKKKEGLYRNAVDEHEKLRFLHYNVAQDYANLKEIHKKVLEENRKLHDEKQDLLNMIKESRPKSRSNMKGVVDGLTNIQSVMYCQNKSVRSMLLQLLDEFRKTKPEKSLDYQYRSAHPEEHDQPLMRRIDELNFVVEKLQKENKKIKENLHEKQINLSRCLTVLENNNADIDNLSEHIEGLCRERDKYAEEIAALENNLLAKNNELEEKNNELESKNNELESKNNQVVELKSDNENLISDIDSLHLKIDTCMADLEKLKDEIEMSVEEKNQYKSQAMEYQNLYSQAEEKLKEFESYKQSMLLTVEKLRSDIKAVEAKETSTFQCQIVPQLVNCQVQESPKMKNQYTESLINSLCTSYKITQVGDSDIYTEHVKKQELQAVNNEFAQYKCLMEFKVQSLEKDKTDLKEQISHYDKDHKYKSELEIKVQTLEKDNSLLRESLASESGSMKLQVEKLKNESTISFCQFKTKISELEIENAGLRDTLNNITSDGRDSLKKLEENYLICKNALELKMRQIEEDNKHLKETLDFVTKDEKSAENEYKTCKQVFETKINKLEKENANLKIHLDFKTEESSKLDAECLKQQAIIAKLNENNQKLQESIKKVEDNMLTLQQQLDNIKQRLESKDSELNEKQSIIKKLKDVQNKCLQQLKRHQQFACPQSELEEELETRIKRMIEENSDMQKLLLEKPKIDQLNQTDEMREINELHKKVVDLESELENANLELTEYEEENRSYSQKLQNLMNEVTCLQETKIQAEEELKELSTKLEILKEELELKDQNIHDLNDKLANLDESDSMSNNLRNELVKIQLENEKFKKEETEWKQKEAQLREVLQKNVEKCSKFQTEIDQLVDTKRNLEEKLNEFDSNKMDLETRIVDLELEIDNKMSEVENLKNNIIELEKDKSSNNDNDNQDLINELTRKQNIIKSLEECITKSNVIIEHCENEMKSVQTINRNLKAELELKTKLLEEQQPVSNPTLRDKTELLFKENKRLKDQLTRNGSLQINKEISTLRKEHDRLLKESQAKDKEMDKIKQDLMQFVGQLKKEPAKKPTKIASTPKSKSCELKPKQQSRTKLPRQSEPPKLKKPTHSVQKLNFAPSQPKQFQHKWSDVDRYTTSPNLLNADKSSLLGDKKPHFVRNKSKNVSVYLALGNTSPCADCFVEKGQVGDCPGPAKSEKTAAKPPPALFDEETCAKITTTTTGTDPIRTSSAAKTVSTQAQSDAPPDPLLTQLRAKILSKTTPSRESVADDPIDGDRPTCDCMSLIMQQYKTYDGDARVENEIYDIVEYEQSAPKAGLRGCRFSFGSYWSESKIDRTGRRRASDEASGSETTTTTTSQYDSSCCFDGSEASEASDAYDGCEESESLSSF
ncbi:unnamed protein product [Phyllotreta striolata]|uniref:Uncharacterized protein n=1 Tax=Phyllotreta striolata TaxID=444603 RepID=A0A9N9U250_PHYSR|nr:unnamed protein product [Phyllotreta striolata]